MAKPVRRLTLLRCCPAYLPPGPTDKTARHTARLSLTTHRDLSCYRLFSLGPAPICQVPSIFFVLRRQQGGDEGARTPDIRLAKAALSQLSYIPKV
jgi:hypothetical protein